MPVLIPLEKKIGFYVFLSNELVCCIILCRKAILRYSDFLHGQACHLWCGPAAMGCSLASKLAGYSITLAPPLSGKSLSMTKIALA